MLKPSPIEPVPEGTARVARAAFRTLATMKAG
jgi:hypothetical protein